MKKPIIFVFGAPHSMTSMVAKFLLDNGAITGDKLENETSQFIDYPRFEDSVFSDFVRAKRDFKFTDKKKIIDYLNSFTTDKVVVMKEPIAVFWINDLIEEIDRPVKSVYVMRDVISNIQSSLERYNEKYDFMKYLFRYSEFYRATFGLKTPLYNLIAERIKEDGSSLLEFCELESDSINFDSVKNINVKETSYVKYRINNFWMKRLFRWLKK